MLIFVKPPLFILLEFAKSNFPSLFKSAANTFLEVGAGEVGITPVIVAFATKVLEFTIPEVALFLKTLGTPVEE